MTYQEDIINRIGAKTVTKIHGTPTLDDVDILQDELAKIAASVKTSLIQEGPKYGHLATMISEQEYCDLINDQTWIKAEPTDPGMYDASITIATTELRKAQKLSAFKIKKKDYEIYLGLNEALRTKITETVDEQFITALDAEWIGYAGSTPLEMITHLRDNVCKISNRDKIKLKEKFREEWDPTKHISTYFRDLEKTKKKLNLWKITTDNTELVVQAVESMYASDLFTEEELIGWENRTDANKTWLECQTYFKEKYENRQRYNNAKAKKTGYHSANNISEAEDGLKEMFEGLAGSLEADKENINLMTQNQDTMVKLNAQLTLQLKGKDEQLSQLMEHNKQLLALLGSKGVDLPKKRTPLTDSDDANKPTKMCTNCHRIVWHKSENCLELEANAANRRRGWKSCLNK
jgi:hypothetical protein